jgi:glycosyltransferase involved in cell wall biosynthesis
MKVLWFTNTPCSSVEILGIDLNFGGWLKSLEEKLSKYPEVSLSVCFYLNYKLDPFKYKDTYYYPVYRKRKNSKLFRYLDRIASIRNDKKEIKNLLEVIELLKPDVIHVHGTEDNFGLIHEHTNSPVLISIQGILNPLAEKFFSGISFCTAYRFEDIIYKIGFLSINNQYRTFLKNAFREIEILRNAKYIMGRTEWDQTITSLLAPKSSYFVGNEILREAFYNNAWDKSKFNQTLVLVTIIGDSLYKGFETIVNTAKLLSEYTGFKFRWKVIGLNANSSTVKIVKRWKKINYDDINLELLGNQSEGEIITQLLESDIYCQVSHMENSANSLCEAMILGMPVIATYAGGTSSLFENKVEGYFFQDGDPYSLAAIIKKLHDNFDKANALGKAARKKALDRHNKNEIVIRLVNDYKSISGNL